MCTKVGLRTRLLQILAIILSYLMRFAQEASTQTMRLLLLLEEGVQTSRMLWMRVIKQDTRHTEERLMVNELIFLHLLIKRNQGHSSKACNKWLLRLL